MLGKFGHPIAVFSTHFKDSYFPFPPYTSGEEYYKCRISAAKIYKEMLAKAPQKETSI